MAPKINRILIPLFTLLLTLLFSYKSSTAQEAHFTSYIPLVTRQPAGWIGPFGGTVVALAFDPTNPQIAYAGSYGSGVYKSIDGGQTWHLASQGITNLFIYSLAIDPLNPSTIYAGTYRNQVFKSIDAGTTWNWSGTGMQAQAIVYSIAVDPVTPQVVYAATRGSSNNGSAPWSGVVYKSVNGGITWYAKLENLGGSGLQDWAYSILVNPHAHNEVLIAAHESGPFRSDNAGGAWYPIDNGILDYSGRSIEIGLQPEFALTYYFGVWHQDSIYKSSNRGDTWTPINRGLTYLHVYDVALDPLNGNNIYLATFQSGILKSSDAGGSWLPVGLPLEEVYSLALNPQLPSTILASTSGNGVYRSENSGVNWVHSDNGIENTMVTSVAVTPTNPDRIFASLSGGGVYRSVDQGKHWSEFNNGLPERYALDLVMDPAQPGVLFALTRDSGIYKNDANTGNGWTFSGQGLPITNTLQLGYPADHPFASLEMQEAGIDRSEATITNATVYLSLFDMVYAPSNPLIAYVATNGDGVYRSNNGGASWQPAGLTLQVVYSLAVDRSNPDLVYAATPIYGSILVTTDGGKNWSNIALNVGFYTLAASPSTNGVVYAGTNNGVFKYQSGAWSSLGLSGQKVTAIKVDPGNPNKIYAGTDQNAYSSVNGGQTWNAVSEDLVGKTIDNITLDPSDPNLVYFSTITHGIFLIAFQN